MYNFALHQMNSVEEFKGDVSKLSISRLIPAYPVDDTLDINN